MRLLVAVADYPRPDGTPILYYVHTRNKYYISQGIDVTVLNFAAGEDYIIDSIPVYTLKSYKLKLRKERFDALVLHAPNIRHHYVFLRNSQGLFPKLVFVFHGHEVLRCSKVYPKPYAYLRETRLKSFVRDYYDILKLRLWKSTFEKLAHKSWFVFVSRWMYDEFIKWVKIDPTVIENRKSIIPNSVGLAFETETYDRTTPKRYDFVTIRSNLDSSKYCVDIVTELAFANPQYSFCVAGRGRYYRFHTKPQNLTLVERYLSHAEIINLLNQSRCALLPTRADAQGVMACEAATFGIPVITSNIPVTAEIFVGFENVAFISNEEPKVDLTPILEKLTRAQPAKKNTRYFAENTSGAEVKLLRHIVEGL